MIKVTFYHQNQQLLGFELSGHAGYAEAGQDIVCSAVSALAINTVNSLKVIAGVTPNIVNNEKAGGYLKVSLPAAKSASTKAQVLLASFELGMSSIAQQYSAFISLN